MNRAGKPETCALCGGAGPICKSHVIPKFFGDWLKRESPTGYLTSAEHRGKRSQDILKIRLLCERCEERFSKHENYFKNKIFDPFEKPESLDKPQSFAYDSSLELFATSLSWRVLQADDGRARSARPCLALLINEAEYCWRQFLLGENQTKPYESHLVFLDGEASDVHSLSGSDLYRFDAVDPKLYADKYRVVAYAKLPHMIVATSIYPTSMKDWKGTEIKESGKITTRQSIRDGAFGEFFAGRARLVTATQDLLSNKGRKGRQEIRPDSRDLQDRAQGNGC